MAELITLIFKGEELQKLCALNPDKVVVHANLVEGRLEDGTNVGYVEVVADAYKEGDDKPLGSIGGCPKPPCNY